MAASDVKMRNLEKVLARFARLAPGMEEAADRRLEAEVAALVKEQQRYAPNDPKTGDNRIAKGIRYYKNPDRPASYRIISDAKDDEGKPIAANVEQGHRNVDGSHTPAHPSFFPIYRARKKKIRRVTLAASRAELKRQFPGA